MAPEMLRGHMVENIGVVTMICIVQPLFVYLLWEIQYPRGSEKEWAYT